MKGAHAILTALLLAPLAALHLSGQTKAYSCAVEKVPGKPDTTMSFF